VPAAQTPGDPSRADTASSAAPASAPEWVTGAAAARSTERQVEHAPQARSADDDVDPDDPDAETAALDSEALLSQALGAQLIEEITHD
jgi:DNA polymerase-3 subunit gamma/tau